MPTLYPLGAGRRGTSDYGRPPDVDHAEPRCCARSRHSSVVRSSFAERSSRIWRGVGPASAADNGTAMGFLSRPDEAPPAHHVVPVSPHDRVSSLSKGALRVVSSMLSFTKAKPQSLWSRDQTARLRQNWLAQHVRLAQWLEVDGSTSPGEPKPRHLLGGDESQRRQFDPSSTRRFSVAGQSRWFNHRRLYSELRHIPPVEAGHNLVTQLSAITRVA